MNFDQFLAKIKELKINNADGSLRAAGDIYRDTEKIIKDIDKNPYLHKLATLDTEGNAINWEDNVFYGIAYQSVEQAE